MGELSQLPNIGLVVEQQLNQAGVFTCAQLQSLGAEKAWLKIQEFDPSACINRLLALEGAILEIKKSALPQEKKCNYGSYINSTNGNRISSLISDFLCATMPSSKCFYLLGIISRKER